MHKGRLEAFSDGVFAIIITIMVLEIKVPHGTDWSALSPLWPKFLSYVMSFMYVGTYWNNHHHMMQAVDKVNGRLLWINLLLLFWLSLLPFASGWMGENHFEGSTIAFYAFVLLMCAIAYFFMSRELVQLHGMGSAFAQAVGSGLKEKFSLLFYIAAIPCALFFNHWVALGFLVVVAFMWLIPDRRVERVLEQKNH